MVRHKIAKDSSWVRIRVTADAIACALALRREFDARRGIAIRFDPRGHRGSFYLPFLPGSVKRHKKLKQDQFALTILPLLALSEFGWAT